MLVHEKEGRGSTHEADQCSEGNSQTHYGDEEAASSVLDPLAQSLISKFMLNNGSPLGLNLFDFSLYCKRYPI